MLKHVKTRYPAEKKISNPLPLKIEKKWKEVNKKSPTKRHKPMR